MGTLHFTHHEPIRPSADLFKAVDAARMSVSAILTYPMVDLAGDYIEPSGGDFSVHKALPWIGLEHYRLKRGTKDELVYPDNPQAGKPIIAGWARESLSEPEAPYAVEHKAFTIKGKQYALPVGTSFYDPDNRLSSQVFAMIEQDALPGVSLELAAPKDYTPDVLKSHSPLEPHRPAWKYDRWECHAWVNCAKPVNPGALVSKSIHDDALACILDRRKIVTGNGTAEPLHPLILKSLVRYMPEADRSRVFVEKAMPTETPVMGDAAPEEATVYDDAHDEQQDEEKGTPTAQVAYDVAQMLVDVCTHAEERLQQSEHVSGKKALLKEIEHLKARAEKWISVGDKVTSDVGKGADATGNIDEEEEPEIDEDETEPDEDDDEKRMKAFRKPHRKVYMKSVRRFTAHEIATAPVVELHEPAPEPEPGNTPEDIEAELKALRKFRKAKRLYGS